MEERNNLIMSCWDEMESVYEKAGNADQNKYAKDILSELEQWAVAEAEFALDEGGAIKYICKGKEEVMSYLSDIGLDKFSIDVLLKSKITIEFSLYSYFTLGCTMFFILNKLEKLEKLDGALDLIGPKVSLELRLPPNGKVEKEMVKCRMLLMWLYPWLSITVTSTKTSTNISTNSVSSTQPPCSGQRADTSPSYSGQHTGLLLKEGDGPVERIKIEGLFRRCFEMSAHKEKITSSHLPFESGFYVTEHEIILMVDLNDIYALTNKGWEKAQGYASLWYDSMTDFSDIPGEIIQELNLLDMPYV